MNEPAQGDLPPNPTKNPKSNKDEDSEQARRDPLSDLPERLQEFRENLVDEKVPEYRDAPASSSRESSVEPVRKEVLGKHSIYTHFPKDRKCEICKRTKITRAPCRKRTDRYAVVVQDLATQWKQSYTCKTKTSQEKEKSLKSSWGRHRKPKVIHTDNVLEFGTACEDVSWNHCTSTLHRSEANGIAEIAVRRIKEGTSAVLLQSGLDEKSWADSMACYCYLPNIQDLWSDGRTPYERRLGEPFKGPIIPFGSLVAYHIISAKDPARLHQFGKKVLPRRFVGYVLYAGGIWKGDIMVADSEEREKMDASEIHAWRHNAKEVISPKIGESFEFPVAD